MKYPIKIILCTDIRRGCITGSYCFSIKYAADKSGWSGIWLLTPHRTMQVGPGRTAISPHFVLPCMSHYWCSISGRGKPSTARFQNQRHVTRAPPDRSCPPERPRTRALTHCTGIYSHFFHGKRNARDMEVVLCIGARRMQEFTQRSARALHEMV